MEWVYIPYKNNFSINHSELPKNNSCWERNIQTFVMVEDFNEIQVKRYCSRHEPGDTKFIAPMDNSTIMHLWLHLHNRHWVSESTQQTLSLRYKHYLRLSNATPQRISLSNTDTANISLQLRLLSLIRSNTTHLKDSPMNLQNTSFFKNAITENQMFFLYKHCNIYSSGSTNIIDYQAEHFLIRRQTLLYKYILDLTTRSPLFARSFLKINLTNLFAKHHFEIDWDVRGNCKSYKVLAYCKWFPVQVMNKQFLINYISQMYRFQSLNKGIL